MTTALPPLPPLVRPYSVTWFGCDFMTGQIIAELPSLVIGGPIERRLGTYSSTTFTLTLAGAPTNWVAATQHGRVMIVGVADDNPIWAGYGSVRSRGSSPTASITATTIEGYFDRRYTGTIALNATDEALIAAALLAVVQDGLDSLDVDAPATGTVRDRAYADSDDKTVYSALTELMGLEDGPEWTVDPVWNSDRSGFRLVARVRKSIGVQDANPQAVFSYPGAVTEYTATESYEDGKGANVLLATGNGEGNDGRIVSDVHHSPVLAQGFPVFEFRWSPSSSIQDSATLNEHADLAEADMQNGTITWALTATASVAPHLGSEWAIGDNLHLTVDSGVSEGHPGGADVVARCWGWSLDPVADTVNPVIVDGG